MYAKIINRGRGPEIEGTRITVLDVLDYLRADCPHEQICALLSISPEQLDAVIAYIQEHRPEVEAAYQQILHWIARGNAPEVEASFARGREKIRAYREARKHEAVHAARGGQ